MRELNFGHKNINPSPDQHGQYSAMEAVKVNLSNLNTQYIYRIHIVLTAPHQTTH